MILRKILTVALRREVIIVLFLSLFLCQCRRNHKTNVKSVSTSKTDTIPNEEFGKLIDALLLEKNINSNKAHRLVNNFFSAHPNVYFTGHDYESYSESSLHSGAMFPYLWYAYDTIQPGFSDFHLTFDSLKSNSGINYVLSVSYACSSPPNAKTVPRRENTLDVFAVSKNKDGYKVIWQDNIEEKSSKRKSIPFRILNETENQNAIYYEWQDQAFDATCFTFVNLLHNKAVPIFELKNAVVNRDNIGEMWWEDFSFKNNFSKLDTNGDVEFEMEYTISSNQQMINHFRGNFVDNPAQLIHKKGKVIYSLKKNGSQTEYEINDSEIFDYSKSEFFGGVISMNYDPDTPYTSNGEFRNAFKKDLQSLMRTGNKDQICIASYFLNE
jgi:hypothetical protein